MKYVKQIAIIWGFTTAGELLHGLLPLPVPAGVYGLFLLLGALIAGFVKLESVQGTGNFLIDIMTLMFLPATVGLMEYGPEIRRVFVPFFIVAACSTLVVMVVTGRTAQGIMKYQEKHKKAEEGRGYEGDT